MRHKIFNSYTLLNNVIREIFDSDYCLFKEDYVDEKSIKKCLKKYKKSLFHDFFINYFNPEIHDTEFLPKGGVILVGNHSFPGWDGLSVLHCLFNQTERITYSLAFKNMSSNNWISLLKSIGIVEGSHEMGNKLLSLEKIVQVYPGGIEDALKKSDSRYKVKPVGGFAKGKHGYLKLARDSGKPILPIGIIGADEVHHIMAHVESLVHPIMKKIDDSSIIKEKSWFKKLAKGVLDCKIVPVPLNLFPLKKKIDIYFGEPIKINKRSNLNDYNDIVMRDIQDLTNYGLVMRNMKK